MRSAYGLEVTRESDWRLRAACRGYDPEWWSLTGRMETTENRMARAICGGCPVKQQCRELADSTPTWGMIFAGESYPRRELTAGEAASISGLSTVAIRAACQEGRLKATRSDGGWQISRAALDDYVRGLR